MNNVPQRVLIVEDEIKLASLLQDYLKEAQFDTLCVHDGNEVIDAFKHYVPDLILLDIMLPGKDGMTLCRELRQLSGVPIIMVTARVDEIDRLLGLELGADDYICKPFSPREVVARVKAVLRRSQIQTQSDNASQAWQLDEHKLQISYRETLVELTAVEYQLIAQLCREPGRIFSRQQLMDAMYSDHRIVSDRTIDSHIKKLRKKLSAEIPGTEFIHSVYGAGYRFEISAIDSQ